MAGSRSSAPHEREIPPEVEAKFAGYPPELRSRLRRLRRLIFETAAATEGVGELEETLKWGQPSYLPRRPKTGTTIRIDRADASGSRYAIYFHCQSRLVETFRELYPERFRFEGNRSLVFELDDAVPGVALRHCIALALTYHCDKRRARAKS